MQRLVLVAVLAVSVSQLCLLTRAEDEPSSNRSASNGPKYLMFYDYDPVDQTGWTNMGFTRVASQVTQGYPLGFKSMFIVDFLFFAQDPSSQHLVLVPNFQANWDAAWSGYLQNLAQNYGLIGVFIGDELLWQGLSVDNLSVAAATVRATWPNATIYWNEQWKTVVEGTNIFGERVDMPQIPEWFDWVSMDYYTLSEEAWTRPPKMYRESLYPKMTPNQSALVVPGSYGSNVNPKYSLQQYEDLMFQNAWGYYQWTLTDPRIIGMNPWYFGPPGCGMPGYEVSTYEMPIVLSMWQKIGNAIVAGKRLERMPTREELQAEIDERKGGALVANK